MFRVKRLMISWFTFLSFLNSNGMDEKKDSAINCQNSNQDTRICIHDGQNSQSSIQDSQNSIQDSQNSIQSDQNGNQDDQSEEGSSDSEYMHNRNIEQDNLELSYYFPMDDFVDKRPFVNLGGDPEFVILLELDTDDMFRIFSTKFDKKCDFKYLTVETSSKLFYCEYDESGEHVCKKEEVGHLSVKDGKYVYTIDPRKNIYTEKCKNMKVIIDKGNILNCMFKGCTHIKSVTFNKSCRPVSTFSMFEGCSNLESVYGSEVTFISMENMFSDCVSLVLLQDISKWRTSEVTSMRKMFSNCSSLEKLPDNCKLCTYSVTDMSDMFSNCSNLQTLPDISNTSKVTNMKSMFSNCSSLEKLPDISKWNTSNVTDMSGMFSDCNNLQSLPDISNWDTSKVTNMKSMFSNCYSLEKLPDISKWNTKNVKNMSYMFSYCLGLKLIPNISGWGNNETLNIDYMFNCCKSLNSIPYNGKWLTSKNLSSKNIFWGCYKLKNVPSGFSLFK